MASGDWKKISKYKSEMRAESTYQIDGGSPSRTIPVRPGRHSHQRGGSQDARRAPFSTASTGERQTQCSAECQYHGKASGDCCLRWPGIPWPKGEVVGTDRGTVVRAEHFTADTLARFEVVERDADGRPTGVLVAPPASWFDAPTANPAPTDGDDDAP